MATEFFSPEIENEFAQYTLGQILWDDKGGAWCYIKANTALSAIHCVGWLPGTWEADLVTATLLGTTHLGNSQIGVMATGVQAVWYGWAQVFGTAQCRVTSVDSSDSFSYTSSTAGTLSDTSTSQQRTRNIVWTVASTATATVPVHLNWPGGNHFV